MGSRRTPGFHRCRSGRRRAPPRSSSRRSRGASPPRCLSPQPVSYSLDGSQGHAGCVDVVGTRRKRQNSRPRRNPRPLQVPSPRGSRTSRTGQPRSSSRRPPRSACRCRTAAGARIRARRARFHRGRTCCKHARIERVLGSLESPCSSVRGMAREEYEAPDIDDRVPFPPMEAELVSMLPDGDGWQYEPKWDGFRGVLENVGGGGVRLWSRNGRPLGRYFPEVLVAGERLPPDSALDGEIVIETEGALDFDRLQMRLHPAESRVRRLAAETPARIVVFDVLLWDGEPVHELPLEERRARVE